MCKTNTKIKIEGVRDFSLTHIFECGQIFRWKRENDGSYTIMADGDCVNLAFFDDDKGSGSGTLVINGALSENEGIWREYLDLGTDYGAIKKKLMTGDKVMATAASYGYGIRLLRQDPWETFISFIVSQNNHIPRIQGCIESLCRQFGEKKEAWNGQTYYAFPSPESLAIADEERLDACRLGYRAKYIHHSAQNIAKNGRGVLDKLRGESVDVAYNALLKYEGVGPKVANCIMLFALDKRSSFPIDVWVRRAMTNLYGMDESDIKGMKAFAKERFGEYGGIAQQYLFYYMKELNDTDK